jgi:thiamine biosynthesis lipoprotein
VQYHELKAMSTEIVVAAEGSAESVSVGFKKVEAFNEQRFTRFSETSELAELNRSAGAWFSASSEMFEVISLASRLHRLTRGLFDPAILVALEMAGYDRSIEAVRAVAEGVVNSQPFPVRQPAGFFMDEGLQPPLPVRSVPTWNGHYHFSDVRLDSDRGRVWLPLGLRIDLGGIAKGWIAERAARLLSIYCKTCAVDAGGDMFLIGLPEGESCWRVALEDPRKPNHNLAILKASPGAVATSAISKRTWLVDGKAYHHLIDPRSGRPAEADWLSVTVMAPHAAEAEVYAKSLLIGGRREVGRVAGPAVDIEFFTVDPHGKLWGSQNSLKFLEM